MRKGGKEKENFGLAFYEMSSTMQFSILIFTLLLSLILVPLTIPYARRLAILDIANHRSSHVGIALRGGGIIFVLVFYVGGLLFLCLTPDVCSLSLIAILFGSLVMATCGWLDDFKDLPVAIRLGVQIVVVVIGCFFLPRVWMFLPVPLEKGIIAFSWLWVVNLFNFMDGTDGYATQEAFFICLGLFLLGLSIGTIALILGFSVLGFLRVNYPKAKILMGDVGSIFLGYILGGLLLYSVTIKELSIMQAIMLTSLFLFDATYTLIKRGLKREKVWKAHREHWYQRLNIAGASHRAIFYIGVMYNLIVVCLLVLNRHYNMPAIIFAVIPCFILVCIALCIKRKESSAGIKKDQ